MYQVSVIHLYNFTITDLSTCRIVGLVQKTPRFLFFFGKQRKMMTRKRKGTTSNHGKYGGGLV